MIRSSALFAALLIGSTAASAETTVSFNGGVGTLPAGTTVI
ncbi:hypothetical protein [Sphingomonas sp. ID1715]|nr:hypothetical protein [Sphingomonas sp. ID1715]